MFIKRITFLFLLVSLIISCNSSVLDLNIDITDPDPEDIGNLFEIPEDVFLIVNISDPSGQNGQIRGFDSSNLLNSPVLAENVATDERFSRISISEDCKYLLYSKINDDNDKIIDLVIKDLNNDSIQLIKSGISSNESGFINNDFIYYSSVGSIYTYEISTEVKTQLVPQMFDRCNHFPVFSLEKDKVVFKDQDPEKTDIASHAWSTVATDFKTETEDYHSFSTYQDITDGDYQVDLYDDFYYSWRDNDHVIFKSKPDLTYKLMEQNVGTTGAQTTNANIQYNGINVLFDTIQISPDRKKLLLYGYRGVYIIDLEEEVTMTGIIEAEQLFFNSNIHTQFGIFSSDSQYLLVGTGNWIGLYDCDSLNKTLFSLSDYLTDDTHIYAMTQTSNWDK